MNFQLMSDWDAMRIADVLTVVEAACCIVGVPTTQLGTNTQTDPYLIRSPWEDESDTDDSHAVFRRVVEALRNSIKAGKLQAVKVYPRKQQQLLWSGEASEGGQDLGGDVDAWTTLIDVDVLKAWLEARNIRPPFFFPIDAGEPDYLNPKHPRYSSKLAASVRAWQAMEDENLRRAKSPVSAMTEWLATRYKEFGLIHRQDNAKSGYVAGDRNDGAIKQAAQVANWQPDGGANKTPTTANPPTPPA